MTISKAEIEKILKTLPIGYYAKRNIKTELHETGGSYYDMINDEITIGMDNIMDALKNAKEVHDVEQTIRGLLYHEISHALLTPKTLKVTDVINIFEDERIESIFRTYYMDVNFRKLVMEVNNFHNEKPKNAMEEFYQTVRYRVGKPHFLIRVNELIAKYKTLRVDTSTWKAEDYAYEVEELYAQICNEWNTKSKETKSESGDESVSNEQSNEEVADQTTSDEDTNEEVNTSKESKIVKISDDRTDLSEEEFENEQIENLDKLVQTITQKYINPDMLNKTNEVLSKLTFMKKRNGSAINSYSGVFDVRSTIRDDYKFFVQKNRLGNVKGFSKFHLNLFIDCSGSFYDSEKIVNQLLYSLSNFEKQNRDFKLDVIFCSEGQKIAKRNERQLKCNGGNIITEEITNQFNSLQLSEYMNYNIVLFDGDAYSDCYSDRDTAIARCKVFNKPNVTIVSDYYNRKYFEKHCKSAKRIYTDEYTAELIKNVFQVLLTSVR